MIPDTDIFLWLMFFLYTESSFCCQHLKPLHRSPTCPLSGDLDLLWPSPYNDNIVFFLCFYDGISDRQFCLSSPTMHWVTREPRCLKDNHSYPLGHRVSLPLFQFFGALFICVYLCFIFLSIMCFKCVHYICELCILFSSYFINCWMYMGDWETAGGVIPSVGGQPLPP